MMAYLRDLSLKKLSKKLKMSDSWARNVANSKNRVSLDTVIYVANSLSFKIFLCDEKEMSLIELSMSDKSKKTLDKSAEMRKEERRNRKNHDEDKLNKETQELIEAINSGKVDKQKLMNAVKRCKVYPEEMAINLNSQTSSNNPDFNSKSSNE